MFPTRRVPYPPLGLDWQIQTDGLNNYDFGNTRSDSYKLDLILPHVVVAFPPGATLN